MRPVNEFEERHYRIRPFGISAALAIFFGACLAVPLIPFWIEHRPLVPMPWIGFLLLSTLLIFPVVFVGIILFDRFVPLAVGPAGISTYNGFGMRTRVPWETIVGVVSVPIGPGLRFLYLKHGKNIFTGAYVGPFVEDYEGMRAYVISLVGPEHPFAKEL